MSAVSASSPALDPDQLQLLTDDIETQHSINLANSALSPIHSTLHPPISTLGPSPPARSSSPRHHSSRHPATPLQPGAGSNSASSRSQRTRRSPYWPSSSSPSRLETSNTWGIDEVCDAAEPVELIGIPSISPADEQFLNSLVSNEFSSPSSYPPLTDISPRSRTSNTIHSNPAGASSRQLPLSRQHTTIHPPAFTTESLSVTQFSASTTQDSVLSPSTNDIDEGTTETADSSFSDPMPAVTRRSNHSPMHQNKKPRMNIPPSSRNQTKHETEEESLFLRDSDDLFGDGQILNVPNNDDLTTIDLTEANEVPDELKKPEVDNRVKLSAFQCVICMDDVTTLTLTHCGHLFCAQCLHSSLHADTTKGKCPMCRSKIDMKPQRSYTSRSKGFWPLELKLMTTTRKGKRKIDDVS